MIKTITPATCPYCRLRDVVVYPNMVIPLFVGRERSMKALDMAMESDKQHPTIGAKKSGYR